MAEEKEAEAPTVGKEETEKKEEKEGNKGEKKRKREKKPKEEKEKKEGTTPSRPSRSRREPERLITSPNTPKEIVIKEGEGKKLEDIKKIADRFQEEKRSHDGFSVLHRIIYGRPGSKHENIKKALLQFSGLVFKNKESDREKLEQRLEKLQVSQLKSALFILALHQSGPKEELVKRLLDFLEKPGGDGSSTPSKPRAKKTPSKSKKRKEKAESDSEEKSEEEDEEEEKSSEESDFDEKKKTKKARKPRKKAKKENESEEEEDQEEKEEEEEEEKGEKDQKEEKEEKKEEAKVQETGDEKEGNGHTKKEKRGQSSPSDTEIAQQVKKLIKEKPDISLRALRDKLSEHFHTSMEDRKDFIRKHAIPDE